MCRANHRSPLGQAVASPRGALEERKPPSSTPSPRATIAPPPKQVPGAEGVPGATAVEEPAESREEPDAAGNVKGLFKQVHAPCLAMSSHLGTHSSRSVSLQKAFRPKPYASDCCVCDTTLTLRASHIANSPHSIRSPSSTNVAVVCDTIHQVNIFSAMSACMCMEVQLDHAAGQSQNAD